MVRSDNTSVPAAINALETTVHDTTREDIGRISSEGTHVPVDYEAYPCSQLRLVHASANSDRFGGVWTRLTPPVGITDASASTHPTCGVSHAQPLANSDQNVRTRALALTYLAGISAKSSSIAGSG